MSLELSVLSQFDNSAHLCLHQVVCTATIWPQAPIIILKSIAALGASSYVLRGSSSKSTSNTALVTNTT